MEEPPIHNNAGLEELEILVHAFCAPNNMFVYMIMHLK